MPFFDSPRPLVFAHRGGCALGPENTLAAFDIGVASGADGLELDVHLSSDGVPVVFHDETLDRTTNGSGLVSRHSVAELARLDAGCRFVNARGERPFAGQGAGVPTLRGVLQRYKDRRVIVEMKVDEPEMGRAVANEVRASGAVDRVCAAGYGRNSMRAAREALPEMATSACHSEVRAALYGSWVYWPLRQRPFGGFQVPERAGAIRVVSPRFIRHAHRASIHVHVWTVDEVDDMERLLQWGVDGLISNRPDLAVETRNGFMSAGQSLPNVR